MLSFGLAMLLKGQKRGNTMKQALSGTKMLLLQGCEILSLGKSLLMSHGPEGGQQGAELCFRAAWAVCSSAETVTGAGSYHEFLLCHCNESFDFRGCHHQHPLDCWNRIRASDWKQMAQAVHEATLCMEQMLRMTSSSAYAHYRYSFIFIYSLQKRSSEHKWSNSSLTLPESALT